MRDVFTYILDCYLFLGIIQLYYPIQRIFVLVVEQCFIVLIDVDEEFISKV